MSEQPAENLQKQDRTTKGTFARGVSGNPKGRMRGSRNKATIAAMELLSGDAENLARRAIELTDRVAALEKRQGVDKYENRMTLPISE